MKDEKAILKAIGFALFTLACITIGGWIAQQVEAFLRIQITWPASVTLLGAALLAAGLLLRVWASYEFYRRQYAILSWKEPTGLIPSGPFAFSRNPHYLAIFLMIAGHALFIQSPTYLAFTAVAFIAFRFVVTENEEKTLAARFGKQYEDYCRKVRRWL